MADFSKMNQLLGVMRPEFMNVDWSGLARKLFIENPRQALQELPQRLQSSTDLLMQYNPGGLVPNQPPTPPEVQQQLLGMAMNQGMAFAPMGVTAYHGSPYLFRQFDPAKLGRGEGAQAYGSGAGYTAEARQVAEEYAKANKGRAAAFAGEIDALPKPVQMEVYKTMQRPEGFIKQAEIADITKRYPETNKIFQESKTYLYKGDIPDEIIPKFLDWDKPIKEQSKEVQNLAKQYKLDMDDLGGDLVGRVGKTPEGSAIMEAAGIRGIKYLDANSRNAKYGSQNFIPFRPEDYKVQEINDIPIEDWISRGLL